jgi:hypothetical protein
MPVAELLFRRRRRLLFFISPLLCYSLFADYAKNLVCLCLPVWNWLMRKYL